MEHYLAIDPGASGAICAFSSDGNVSAYNIPETPTAIAVLINALAPIYKIAYLEKVGGFINVGGKQVGTGPAMFNFGTNYGVLLGGLLVAGFKVFDVLPQEWQKGLHVGSKGFGDKKARKQSYRDIAAKKFPEIKVTAKNADALCIGLWAMPAAKWQPLTPEAAESELVGREMSVTLSKKPPCKVEAIDPFPHKTRVEKLTVKEQYAEAVAWCKRNGWKVPAKGPQRTEMFDDWFNRAINGEA